MKKITTGGTFRFHNRLLYLANAMVDQHIALEETDDGIHRKRMPRRRLSHVMQYRRAAGVSSDARKRAL